MNYIITTLPLVSCRIEINTFCILQVLCRVKSQHGQENDVTKNFAKFHNHSPYYRQNRKQILTSRNLFYILRTLSLQEKCLDQTLNSPWRVNGNVLKEEGEFMLIRQTSPSLSSSQNSDFRLHFKLEVLHRRGSRIATLRTYLERIWAINILSSVSALKVALEGNKKQTKLNDRNREDTHRWLFCCLVISCVQLLNNALS